MSRIKSWIFFSGSCAISGVICALFVFLVISSATPAAAQTELGSEDDLTILGTDGTAADPDAEIKGFTVFGSTQADYSGAIIGPGNVVVNGVLAVSSGAYFVGNSTFTGAGNIFINDGSTGQLLRRNTAGNLEWVDSSAIGDNLGGHTATQDLNMSSRDIVGVSTITVSSITTTVAGVTFSTSVFIMNGNVGIGAAVPGAKLDIQGGTVQQTVLWRKGTNTTYGALGAGDAGVGVEVFNPAAGYGIGFSVDGGEKARVTSSGGFILGNTYLPTDPGAGSMIISGNVGIGTTAPGAKLHTVEASGSGSYIFVASTAADSGSFKMVVSTQGNVAIGTINPSGRLEVYGGAEVTVPVSSSVQISNGNLYLPNGAGIYLGNSAGTSFKKILARGSDFNQVELAGGSGEVLLIMDTSRRLGLGYMNSNPSAINANDGGVSFYNGSATGATSAVIRAGQGQGSVGLFNIDDYSGSALFAVNAGGAVGVGTAAPSSKFDVLDGSITVRGTNAGIVLDTGSRSLLPETDAGLGAGIRVSTNVYIVGFASATRYFGDGSALTGVFTGDDLGDHTATQDLNMSSRDIVGVSTITVSSITTTVAGVTFSTSVFIMNGNVGIRTANPEAPLHVNGRVHIGTDNGSSLLSISPYTTNNIAYLSARESPDSGGTTKMVIQTYNAGTAKSGLTVDEDGQVGISETTPLASLHINGDGNQLYLEHGGSDSGWKLNALDSDGMLRLTRRTSSSDSVKWYVTPAGNLGLGMVPARWLDLSTNSARKPGTNTWEVNSDRRLKNNIAPLKNALDNMLALHGVTFEWKEPEKQGNLTGRQMGMIAQEVEKVFPEWVGTGPDGYKTLKIGGFEGLTAEAFRELMARLAAQQAQIDALREEVRKLRKQPF